MIYVYKWWFSTSLLVYIRVHPKIKQATHQWLRQEDARDLVSHLAAIPPQVWLWIVDFFWLVDPVDPLIPKLNQVESTCYCDTVTHHYSLSSLFAESQLLRWTSKSLFVKIPAYCRFLPIFEGEKHATHWMFYFSQRNPKVSEVATGFGSQCLSFKSCNYMIFSVEASKHRPWTGI
jgi:hypothetical protein